MSFTTKKGLSVFGVLLGRSWTFRHRSQKAPLQFLTWFLNEECQGQPSDEGQQTVSREKIELERKRGTVDTRLL